MKAVSLSVRLNRAAFIRQPAANVAELMGPSHLGFWHKSYWTMRVRQDAADIVETLNGFLNDAPRAEQPMVAIDISEFLAIPEIKKGFQDAPKDCGLGLLNTRLGRVMRHKEAPAIQHRSLKVV